MNECKQWKNEFRNIKQRINLHEKGNFTTNIISMFPLNKTTTLKSQIAQMQKQEETSYYSNQKEKEQMLNEIKVLRKDTNKLKEKLKTFERNNEDLYKLQDLSEKLENNFTNFKTQQIELFEDLAINEQQLEEELSFFQERLENFDKVQDKQKKLGQQNYQQSNQQQNEYYEDEYSQKQDSQEEEDEDDEDQYQIKQQVELFDKKIEKRKQQIDKITKQIINLGGQNQGWSDQDQRDFLRLKVKHKNNITKQAFMNDCFTCFAFMDQEAIKNHIQQHLQVMELEETKKKMLEDYKNMKNQKLKIQQVQIREEEKSVEDAKKRKKKLELQKQKENELKKQQVREWKMRKQIKEEIIKQNNQYDKQLTEYEKKQEKMYQEQLKKQQVKEFKEQKEVEKQRKLERQQEQQSKRPITAEERQRIQAREINMINKRLQSNQQIQKDIKEQMEYEKQQRIQEEKFVKYAHVKNKLDHVTQATETRQRTKYDGKGGKDAQTFGGNVVRTSGVASVSWRQGL